MLQQYPTIPGIKFACVIFSECGEIIKKINLSPPVLCLSPLIKTTWLYKRLF